MSETLKDDIKEVLNFIFVRFGAPVSAVEIPDDVVSAVRRLERWANGLLPFDRLRADVDPEEPKPEAPSVRAW